MAHIEILDTGLVHEEDSAYPTLARAADGSLLAAFTVGSGPQATGGTAVSRSTDGGRTWRFQGMILPASSEPPTTNSLRLSVTPDGTALAYGMRKYLTESDQSFGHHLKREAIYCVSTDGGRTWSSPQTLAAFGDCPLEVVSPILVTTDGLWLAPAATLAAADRLGETVFLAASADQGRTWPERFTVFHDPAGVQGFFEHKILEFSPRHLLATAWTVKMGAYEDLENHFALSEDGGRSWTRALPTGLHGQTLTPVRLGPDRILVLYNKRQGRQGVQVGIVRIRGNTWTTEHESTLWAAAGQNPNAEDREVAAGGLAALPKFEFGLPSALSLDDGTHLAVHWCVEDDLCHVRWTRLRVT